MVITTEDIIMLNGLLDKLTQNKFFENYKELKDCYDYLANKYHFDLKTHTVDPKTGEITLIDNKDKVYFDKKTEDDFA
jgi:hypothetical protein